ncbi:MAG: hypothetical protein ABIN25_04585 [Ginsengibacter sp.]
MIKIIWVLIGLNLIALIVFLLAYFVWNDGREVATIEKGYLDVFAFLMLVIILLAAIPLRYSQSMPVVIFCGFIAVLPLALVVCIGMRKAFIALQKKSFAETYYQDKTQRRIAAAIEHNDTIKLTQLIKGQDLNIKGISVWGEEGLNYLQFAIRLRVDTFSFPINDEANTAAIKILIANGAATSPALSEAVKYLSPGQLLLLLNAGADPNLVRGIDDFSVLFKVINDNILKIDIAILLIQNGADINALKDSTYTPVMYAAYMAGTSEYMQDNWRLVRYLLEEAHANYTYTAKNGTSLGSIIKNIKQQATEKNIVMPPDFIIIEKWLKKNQIVVEAL